MSQTQKCELCGSVEHKMFLPRIYAFKDKGYDLVQCRKCGLVFVQPMPDLETIAGFYTDKYFESDFSCGMFEGGYLETESSRVEEYREVLGSIEKHKTSGKLLEIGCAAGSFLFYAKRSGFEVEGVDISEWAVTNAAKQFGIKVHQGRLMDVGLPDASCDVILLSDLLEHEPEPIKFLKEVARVLKPDGICAIKVPTYVNSFYYQIIKRLPWSWTLGKLDEKLLQALKVRTDGPKFPPYHLYEYSPATLKLLLSRCGMTIVDRTSFLLVPDFLELKKPGLTTKLIWAGFVTLRWIIKRLNVHGGHTIVISKKETPR
jgi:SAM-dependent methyltransferase